MKNLSFVAVLALVIALVAAPLFGAGKNPPPAEGAHFGLTLPKPTLTRNGRIGLDTMEFIPARVLTEPILSSTPIRLL